MPQYAVIGDPVKHSLSPFIHNHLIRKYRKEPASYIRVKLDKDKPELFPVMWDMLDLEGANVTMPHKHNVMKYVAGLSRKAELYQSVNTIKRTEKGLLGYNTDADGFLKSLYELDFFAGGKKVLITGAGGVTSTLILALIEENASRITVAARNHDSAIQLQTEIKNICGQDIEICGFSQEDLGGVSRECDLFVNATPLGMHGVLADFERFEFLKKLPDGALVYDLIYNPAVTNLLKNAELYGYKTVNGLSMLIWQAFYAFNIFFDQMPADEDKIELEKIINKGE